MGRRILSDAGYEVTTVNNGAAALKKISEIKPDLIILDVYMPGYGGLEVCQRMKESPDTARIPILLTVGKMEPFKAEEAKRVRADSYIIKPFEASELLTALARLEDRIVPIADGKKPGRAGKAAAGSQATAKKIESGDGEWKNRLRIPPPSAKTLEIEPREPQKSTEPAPAGSSFRDLARQDELGAAEGRSFEAHHSPTSEITPAEIAAMVSATVNAVPKTEKLAESGENFAGQNEQLAQPHSDVEAATLASAFIDSTPPHPEPAELLEKVERDHSREDLRNLSASEADVATMLASLQPASGDGQEAEGGSFARLAFTGSGENAALASATPGKPRWMAHSVAITEQESMLMLAEEMAKTLAADAAAYAKASPDLPTAEETASVMKELLSVVAFAEAAAGVRSTTTGDSHFASVAAMIEPATSSDGLADQPGAVSAPAEYPENRGLELPAIPVPTADEFSGARNTDETGFAQSDKSESQPESQSEPQPEPQEGAAFAAAASAGQVAPAALDQAIAVPAIASADAQEGPSENPVRSLPASDPQAERQRETELAAAWQNWKQIRDTILRSDAASPGDPQPSSARESSLTGLDAGFKDIRREPSPADQPASAVEAEDSDPSIASIVDSVLADLKPRLMEEIARKMGKEKK
jgi:CheY-like chemotaxis protein